MAGGDTGAPPKTGGQGYVLPRLDIAHFELGEDILTINRSNRDAFQRREKANEDFAIKQREKEKLLELKKKISEQQAHLKKLEESM
jgi:ATPase inhibitor, mitochondrial